MNNTSLKWAVSMADGCFASFPSNHVFFFFFFESPKKYIDISRNKDTDVIFLIQQLNIVTHLAYELWLHDWDKHNNYH